ncbi:MAG TPA: universal stress protein [Polyangiaceae bacterium]|nr:universal stress protein [Polyangiaceae bacterium]
MGEGAPARVSIQHILVPHDFSETADHALAYALGLAQKLGAKVTILHAYEIPAYGFPEVPALTLEAAGQIERGAQSALDAVARRAQRPGVAVAGVLRHGPAWSEIDAAAKESRADMIVLGTHGRRGLARALLGSVAEKVVRTAPCPVLTVHVGDVPGASA